MESSWTLPCGPLVNEMLVHDVYDLPREGTRRSSPDEPHPSGAHARSQPEIRPCRIPLSLASMFPQATSS